MLTIPQQEWDNMPEGYTGIWTREIWEERGRDFPERFIGKRTMLQNSSVLTEGEHFIIVPHYRHEVLLSTTPALKQCRSQL